MPKPNRFEWPAVCVAILAFAAAGIRVLVHVNESSLALERERAAQTTQPKAPGDGALEVTIDGREASPGEKRAWKAIFEQLVSRAVGQAAKELLEELDIGDPMEAELFSAPWSAAWNDEDLLSVLLIGPGKEGTPPRTTELRRGGRPVIIFTRTAKPVERPLASITVISLNLQRPSKSETHLVYGTDGKWKLLQPAEARPTRE